MSWLDRMPHRRQRAAVEARRARQLPVTARDVTEIVQVGNAALQEVRWDGKVAGTTMTQRSGLIVRTPRGVRPVSELAALTAALENIGYVVEPHSRHAVLVTGIDPVHYHGELTRERIYRAIEELTNLAATTFDPPPTN